MEYRVNFIIGAASTIFLQLAGLLTIWVIMQQIPSLNGWGLYEILLIYGLFTGFIYFSNTYIQSYFSVNIFILINFFFPISGVYLLYDFWQKVLRGKGQIYALAWFLILPRILYILFLFMLIYIDKYNQFPSILDFQSSDLE